MVALLKGAYIIPPSVITEGRGISVKYTNAVLSKRYIHVSDAFKAAHNSVYTVLSAAITSRQSKWNEISRTVFADKKATVYKDRAQMVALVCRKDKTAAPFTGKKHVYDGPEFLKLLKNEDLSRCALGFE